MAIIQFRVTILGIDVSEDVESIDAIQNTLDVPRLTEYTVSDVSFQLMPNEFEYAPDKNPNFFTANSHAQSGYRAEVEIQGGIRGETLTTLFSGIIVELSHDVTGQGYRVVATDKSIDLREDTITDFGLRKNNNLRAAAEQTTLRGQFNFSDPVVPVSEDSVSGTLGGDTLEEVQNLAEEGELSPTNFQLADDGNAVITETAPEDASDVLNATYKAPFRGISINRVIRELLNDYDITPTDVKLPLMRTLNPHWSHISRPGYEIESATGTNPVPFGWNGYVTDMVRNPSNGDIFMLYSHRGTAILPQLLKYTASNDTWASIYQASAHAEWWQLATADYETFFIMQTTGIYEMGVPRLATYNPSETNQASPVQTSILKLDTSDNTTTPFANSGIRRPQMAVHYWYGFISGTAKLRANNSRFGFVPDTRTGFTVAENAVWYRFANTTQFGLARIRTSNGSGSESVMAINRDEFANEASFDFTLDVPNRLIYGSHSTIGESSGELRSRHLVYSLAMPAAFS